MTHLIFKPSTFLNNDSIFDNFLSDFFHSDINYYANKHSINDSDDQVTVTVDVPGFEKSEISIDYDKDILTIIAKKESDESNRSSITKTFTISNIDIKKSTADLSNGVLTLTLEKTTKAKKQTLKIT